MSYLLLLLMHVLIVAPSRWLLPHLVFELQIQQYAGANWQTVRQTRSSSLIKFSVGRSLQQAYLNIKEIRVSNILVLSLTTKLNTVTLLAHSWKILPPKIVCKSRMLICSQIYLWVHAASCYWALLQRFGAGLKWTKLAFYCETPQTKNPFFSCKYADPPCM